MYRDRERVYTGGIRVLWKDRQSCGEWRNGAEGWERAVKRWKGVRNDGEEDKVQGGRSEAAGNPEVLLSLSTNVTKSGGWIGKERGGTRKTPEYTKNGECRKREEESLRN